MRIAVTSDTHYYPRWQKELEQMIGKIADHQPDCLILAGDIGETIDGFDRMLALCQRVKCPRLVLAGNHDVWANTGASSEQLWTTILPHLTKDNGAIWLESTNWIRNGIGVCGTIGWYDYSGRDPSLLWTDQQYAVAKQHSFADGTRIKWDWNDPEFSSLVGDAFASRLASLDVDPMVREILVVTHVPAFAETIIRKANDPDWLIGNAYFYNLTLGRRILTSAKVTRVVSGHTHVGVIAQTQGPTGLIDIQVLDADYGKPAFVLIDYPDRPFQSGPDQATI